MRRYQVWIGVLMAIAVIFPTSAWSITIGGTTYFRSGNHEAEEMGIGGIDASFGGGMIDTAALASEKTALTYSGFVELRVSGFGQACATRKNDAFYILEAESDQACFGIPSETNHNTSFYQLAIDTAPIQGDPGPPLTPTPSGQLAKNLIVFDIDAGIQTAPGTVPMFQADNEYRFVIDTELTAFFLSNMLSPGTANSLFFTVANGVYSDNSGEFNIDVYQLQPVLEPSTWLLLGSGLVGLAFYGWRKRKREQAEIATPTT